MLRLFISPSRGIGYLLGSSSHYLEARDEEARDVGVAGDCVRRSGHDGSGEEGRRTSPTTVGVQHRLPGLAEARRSGKGRLGTRRGHVFAARTRSTSVPEASEAIEREGPKKSCAS